MIFSKDQTNLIHMLANKLYKYIPQSKLVYIIDAHDAE